MSYLVVNPVDRFSCDRAYITRYQDSEKAINIISYKHPSLKVKPDNFWTFQVYNGECSTIEDRPFSNNSEMYQPTDERNGDVDSGYRL